MTEVRLLEKINIVKVGQNIAPSFHKAETAAVEDLKIYKEVSHRTQEFLLRTHLD